jgi:protein involved in polysaccharide export with SLBB domain
MAPPADYRFAAGDVIEVTVAPQHNFDRTVTVQPDGKISFPRLGQLQVSGLTVAQLVTQVHDGLNRQLVDPLVTISLKEASKRDVGRVTLLGEVHTPGGMEIKDGTTVAEALAAAGGPTPRANLQQVTITRADGTVTTVNLAKTEETGRVERTASLQPGDIIVVPEGPPPTVLVLGEVTKPGPYEIQRDARLLDAIAEAGGTTNKADLRRVTLTRLGVPGTRTIDLQPLLVHGDTRSPDLNVALQPGDTIFISETDQRVYVFGRVARPDIYTITPSDRVLDLLLRAGGAGADGDISKAALIRRGPDGRPVAQNLDLKKMMATGDMAKNEPLQPGDVLFVPDRKSHHSPLESLSLLFPLTGLLNLFR